MAPKTIQSNEKLAKQLRLRRNELGLTIEEAAARAGVGTKTWSRYEAGASIRADKCRGICKAMNWRAFPNDQAGQEQRSLMEECRDHVAWSQFLADNYGERAALSFAAGSDILLDHIEQDLSDLASMPADSHIGQLGSSMISDMFPPQFLTRYDHEFLYQIKCTLLLLRERIKMGMPLVAHSILEELLIYLCAKEAEALLELGEGLPDDGDNDTYGDPTEWVFDLFDDQDILTFLYSDMYLHEDHPFHFCRWDIQQFYMD